MFISDVIVHKCSFMYRIYIDSRKRFLNTLFIHLKVQYSAYVDDGFLVDLKSVFLSLLNYRIRSTDVIKSDSSKPVTCIFLYSVANIF